MEKLKLMCLSILVPPSVLSSFCIHSRCSIFLCLHHFTITSLSFIISPFLALPFFSLLSASSFSYSFIIIYITISRKLFLLFFSKIFPTHNSALLFSSLLATLSFSNSFIIIYITLSRKFTLLFFSKIFSTHNSALHLLPSHFLLSGSYFHALWRLLSHFSTNPFNPQLLPSKQGTAKKTEK